MSVFVFFGIALYNYIKGGVLKMETLKKCSAEMEQAVVSNKQFVEDELSVLFWKNVDMFIENSTGCIWRITENYELINYDNIDKMLEICVNTKLKEENVENIIFEIETIYNTCSNRKMYYDSKDVKHVFIVYMCFTTTFHGKTVTYGGKIN